MLACIENNCEITYHCYYFRNHKFEILLTLYLGPSRNYVCSKAEFPESPFSRPDFESETAWDVYSRPIPSPSLDHWWISRSRPSPRRVLRRESRYFESDSPFFPLKSFNLCPYSNINTAQNVMTSPRPGPILEHPWISNPSPRPRRVLDRETRPFESETRDSGNSACALTVLMMERFFPKETKSNYNLTLFSGHEVRCIMVIENWSKWMLNFPVVYTQYGDFQVWPQK